MYYSLTPSVATAGRHPAAGGPRATAQAVKWFNPQHNTRTSPNFTKSITAADEVKGHGISHRSTSEGSEQGNE